MELINAIYTHPVPRIDLDVDLAVLMWANLGRGTLIRYLSFTHTKKEDGVNLIRR